MVVGWCRGKNAGEGSVRNGTRLALRWLRGQGFWVSPATLRLTLWVVILAARIVCCFLMSYPCKDYWASSNKLELALALVRQFSIVVRLKASGKKMPSLGLLAASGVVGG